MSNGSPVETTPGRGASILLWVLAIAASIFWLAITVGIFGYAIRAGGPATAWAACMLFTLALLVLAGREVNGRWSGVLIDARNKYSLARLQIMIWTVMVMTAYLTFALPRIRLMAQGTLTQADALNITFPKELILAMGISAVSFAGSSLIKRTKTSKTTTIDLKSTPDATRARRDQAKTDLAVAESQLVTALQTQKTREEELAASKKAFADAADDAAKKAAQERVDMAQILLKSAVLDSDKATRERDAKKAALDAAEKDFVAATEAEGLLHRNGQPVRSKLGGSGSRRGDRQLQTRRHVQGADAVFYRGCRRNLRGRNHRAAVQCNEHAETADGARVSGIQRNAERPAGHFSWHISVRQGRRSQLGGQGEIHVYESPHRSRQTVRTGHRTRRHLSEERRRGRQGSVLLHARPGDSVQGRPARQFREGRVRSIAREVAVLSQAY
jgi:hypothetical protein